MIERFDLIEFGQIFSRFGSRVTIVDALERIAPPADADASGTLAAALEEERIELIVSAFVKSVRRDGEDVAGMHHVFPTFGQGVKAAAEQAR